MGTPKSDEKNKLNLGIAEIVLFISLISIACIYFLTGIFSIIISLILASIIGFITSILKKNRKMQLIFSVFFVLVLLGAAAFFVLLSSSNM